MTRPTGVQNTREPIAAEGAANGFAAPSAAAAPKCGGLRHHDTSVSIKNSSYCVPTRYEVPALYQLSRRQGHSNTSISDVFYRSEVREVG
jgi:hypothetical protein